MVQVCHHFRHIQAGGLPVETTGRPKDIVRELTAELTAMAPPPFFSAPPPAIHRQANSEILCPVCMDIVDQPLDLLCGNLVCLHCCVGWVTSSARQDCLCCYNCLLHHARAPSRLTMTMIGSQLVECPRGCNRIVKLEYYQSHVQSKCRSHFEHSILSPSRTTVREILDRDGVEATPTERMVAQHVVKKIMAEAGKGQMIQLPTRGQVYSVNY